MNKPQGVMEIYEQPRERGCFFYGCIIAIVLVVVLIIVTIAALYMGYRYVINQSIKYTDTVPMPLATVKLDEAQLKSLKERYQAFHKALEENKPADPLVLTGPELTSLITEGILDEGDDDMKSLKDKVALSINGDKIVGQISVPLSGLPKGLGELEGRYINGEAEFTLKLEDDKLDVRVKSLKVKGESIDPNNIGMGSKNLAESVSDDEDEEERLSKIESITVKDGKLTIAAKPPEKRPQKRPKKEGEDKKGGLKVKIDLKGDKPKEEAKPAEPPKEESKAKAAPKEESKAKEEPKAKDAPKPEAKPDTPKTSARTRQARELARV